MSLLDRGWTSLQYRMQMNESALTLFLGSLFLLALLLVLCWKLKRTRSRWLTPVLCVTLVGIERLCLLGNPWVWSYYAHTLTADEVDFRGYDMLTVESDRYRRGLYGDKNAILAVGSSQTRALFSNKNARQHGIYAYWLAGMGPLDLVLYQARIAECKPRLVLLYLSEFDMAREPNLALLFSAPSQGLDWIPLLQTLSHCEPLRPKLRGAALRAVAAELVPEYRYSYIVKGLWSRWSGGEFAYGATLPSQVGPEERRLQQKHNLATNLAPGAVPISLELVESFLGYCEHQGIPVVILEGAVNPAIENSQSVVLHQQVDRALEAMASRFTHVRYIHRASFELSPADYEDGTHVTPAAAERFVENVVPLLPDAL